MNSVECMWSECFSRRMVNLFLIWRIAFQLILVEFETLLYSFRFYGMKRLTRNDSLTRAFKTTRRCNKNIHSSTDQESGKALPHSLTTKHEAYGNLDSILIDWASGCVSVSSNPSSICAHGEFSAGVRWQFSESWNGGHESRWISREASRVLKYLAVAWVKYDSYKELEGIYITVTFKSLTQKRPKIKNVTDHELK